MMSIFFNYVIFNVCPKKSDFSEIIFFRNIIMEEFDETKDYKSLHLEWLKVNRSF